MKRLDNLLQKEVTRKQFVSLLIGAVFGLTGLPSIIGLFSKNLQEVDKNNLPEYGEQRYGP